MKRLLLWMLWIVPLTVAGQSRDFDAFYGKYAECEGVTAVSISGDMAWMLGEDMLGGVARIAGSFSNIESVRLIAVDRADDAFRSDLEDFVDRGNFKELITVNEADERMYLLRRTVEKANVEFLMIVFEGNEATVLDLVGDIDLREVTSAIDSVRR